MHENFVQFKKVSKFIRYDSLDLELFAVEILLTAIVFDV